VGGADVRLESAAGLGQQQQQQQQQQRARSKTQWSNTQGGYLKLGVVWSLGVLESAGGVWVERPAIKLVPNLDLVGARQLGSVGGAGAGCW